MKTVYRHQVYMGSIGDMKALEQHFSLMAKKGWMIDKIGVLSHCYKSIEPCEKQFFVDLLPQITAFDYPENEDAQNYRHICEDSGWSFVAANKQFHVFCAEANTPAPVPIHTDNSIQAKIYLKACRRNEMLAYVIALPVFCYLYYTDFVSSGIELLLSNLNIFRMLGYSFFLIGNLWMTGFIILWYRNTLKSAKLDLPMPTINYKLSRIRGKTFIAGMVAFVVCLITGISLEILNGLPVGFLFIFLIPFIGLGVGLWVRRQIDTKRRERKANIRMFVIAIIVTEIIVFAAMGITIQKMIPRTDESVTLDNRPALTLQDIGITDNNASSNTIIRGSVAVPIQYNYWEISKAGSVHTDVYASISRTITQGLYDRYTKELFDSYGEDRGYTVDTAYLSPSEAASWGAQEGVIAVIEPGKSIRLILLRDKTLICLSLYKNNNSNIYTDKIREAVQKLWDNIK